jgi:hypothetical protein
MAKAKSSRRRTKAGERRRDEARGPGGPRYGGTAWKRADERAPDERFGHTRIDRAADLRGAGAPEPSARGSEEASFAAASTSGAVSAGENLGIGRGAGAKRSPRHRAPSRRQR